MNARGLITGILGIAMLGMVFTACESDSPISLEESLRDTPNVQLKEGATDVGIKVNNDYKRSYYRMELSNLLPESKMSDGNYAAWCVLYDTPISSNAAEYGGVKLYDTSADPSYQKVRYLINNKNKFMKDLDADWKDVQVAIWSLLDFPKFDYTKNLDRLPSEFNNNGVPTFNTENVDLMVSTVAAADIDEEDFNCEVYLAETRKDVQNGLIEDCETAMARNEDDPETYTIKFDHQWFSYVSFPRNNVDNPFSNPNDRDLTGCEDYDETYFMYSNKTFLGLFCISHTGGGEYDYKFVLDTDWEGTETHIEIVSNPSDFPQPVPWSFGQYANKEVIIPGAQVITGTATGAAPSNGGKVYISAHAVVYEN